MSQEQALTARRGVEEFRLRSALLEITMYPWGVEFAVVNKEEALP